MVVVDPIATEPDQHAQLRHAEVDHGKNPDTVQSEPSAPNRGCPGCESRGHGDQAEAQERPVLVPQPSQEPRKSPTAPGIEVLCDHMLPQAATQEQVGYQKGDANGRYEQE